MDSYRVVLFLHLVALAVLVGAITLVGASYMRLRAARSLEQAATWTTLAGQTTILFPVAILGLFASGAYLTSDRWSWSTPWIDVSIVALVLLAVQGPLLAGRTTSQLRVQCASTRRGRSARTFGVSRVRRRSGSSSAETRRSCSRSSGT